MAIFTRRSTKVGLFAVAVAALAVAPTGTALAADTVPSVRVQVCTADGEPWEMIVTGVNQDGVRVTETFSGDHCAVFSKDGTDYWWALGTGLSTIESRVPKLLLLPDDPALDGITLSFILDRETG